MATRTPKRVYTNHIPATLTPLFTVDANRYLLVTRVSLLNVTGSASTVDLYLVPSGGTAGIDNQILKSKSLAASMQEPYLVSGFERQILQAGDTIQAVAGAANTVTAVISGILITASS